MKDIADDIFIEIQLITLAFAAGINDATTFPDYHVFVSNQTGNTALFAVGAFSLAGENPDLANIGVSLGLFIAAGLILGQIGDHVGRRRKAWLLTTNAFQTVVMIAGAALRKWLSDGNHRGPHAWSVIALLAFSSGGQVAMARTLNMPEVPTAMVTSAYIDFLVDPQIISRHNRPRNRRLFFVLSLVTGSFVGAASYKMVEPALAIFLASLLKLFVFISFFFNRTVDTEATCEDYEETLEENDPGTLEENDPGEHA